MGQSQRVIGKSVIVASSQDENSLIHLDFPSSVKISVMYPARKSFAVFPHSSEYPFV